MLANHSRYGHSSLVVVAFFVICVGLLLYKQDVLYSLYMGSNIPVDLSALKLLLDDNKHLQNPLNKILTAKSSNKKIFSDNFIVLDSKLKVTIAEPNSRDVTTSNVVNWFVQGKALFRSVEDKSLKPLDYLHVQFTFDGVLIDGKKEAHRVVGNNKLVL